MPFVGDLTPWSSGGIRGPGFRLGYRGVKVVALDTTYADSRHRGGAPSPFAFVSQRSGGCREATRAAPLPNSCCFCKRAALLPPDSAKRSDWTRICNSHDRSCVVLLLSYTDSKTIARGRSRTLSHSLSTIPCISLVGGACCRRTNLVFFNASLFWGLNYRGVSSL